VKAFEPALYSLEENQFLLDHMGEPPTVALHGGLPVNVNPKAVVPVLQQLYDLEELKRLRGVEWIGLEPIKESITNYLKAHNQWASAHRAGAPKNQFPTFYEFDSRGRGHHYGVNSDAGYVRSFFDENGNRQSLRVDLTPSPVQWVPPQVAQKAASTPNSLPETLIEDDVNGLIQCPVCRHTENYEPGVQSKRTMARTRMSKHLVKATREPEAHRHVYSAVFGAPDSSIR
jgi:hypothetical protein